MRAAKSLARVVAGACLIAACSDSGDDAGGAANGGGAASGGSNPFGNSSQGNGGSGASSGGAGGTGNTTGLLPDGGLECADTLVRTSRVTPTVILLVDQSGSMEEEFGDDTRWNVLRDFLLEDPDGLIADLQQQVRFGLALYSAEPDADECPLVTTVDPAIDNFDAIAATYRDAEPISDTPTGDSIDAVVERFGLAEREPDSNQGPTVIVLATDGEPDRCEELNPQNGQEEAIAAAARAYGLGVRTFIISVGNEVSAQHQQDMANAGLGRQAGDADAEYWTAGDDASLRAALTDIVGAQLGCEVQLNGAVQDGNACSGHVSLNGRDLTCGDDNGWELSTPTTIRLLGSACDELKSSDDVLLDVSFPCDVGFVF